MKYRLKITVLSLVLFVCLSFSVSAASPLLVDNAELLTDTEASQVLSFLTEASDTLDYDVVILTEQSTDGIDAEQYADDFFDTNGYGRGSSYDGVLLLLVMDEGEWVVSTSGDAIDTLPTHMIDSIMDSVIPALRRDDFVRAFADFSTLVCDAVQNDGFLFLPDYEYDADYDDYDEYAEGEPPIFTLIVISLVIGVIVAAIITGAMKSQLKSVRPAADARFYTKKDSLQITASSDRFLYRNVIRTARQNSSDRNGKSGGIRISSSGRSHGGSRGRF